jgi:hypothetical protein
MGLRSGASLAAIDSDGPLLYTLITQEEMDEGDRTGSPCHPCFLRSKMRMSKAQRSLRLAVFIASERLKLLEHPPQSQIRKKLEPHIPRSNER